MTVGSYKILTWANWIKDRLCQRGKIRSHSRVHGCLWLQAAKTCQPAAVCCAATMHSAAWLAIRMAATDASALSAAAGAGSQAAAERSRSEAGPANPT